jgi:hypothetical protein
MMFFLTRGLIFLVGVVVVWLTLRSAIRTYLLPRSAPDAIVRLAFIALRKTFGLVMAPLKTYAERDRVLAYYSPLGMLMLLAVWLILVLLGYTCMFWAIGVESGLRALALSGSSLFTLGYEPVTTLPQKLLTFTEAFVGPVLIALLIGYMPTIYGAFSKREALVNLLEIRAGNPPSAVGMITRYHRLNRLPSIGEMWVAWETWFTELEETHTSLAMLSFFRSPVPEHHWVSAAGAVLDAAALVLSTVDLPFDVQSALCLRGGYIALRRIADYFRLPYDPDPRPDDPISVTRTQFDNACDLLALEGVPLVEDRDQAWRDFAGWRVNYDTVLLALARLTMATPAPWSSPEMPDQLRLPEAGRDS